MSDPPNEADERQSSQLSIISPSLSNAILAPQRVGTLLSFNRTNVDVSTEEGKALLVNAQGVAELNVREATGTVFLCQNYLLVAAERVDEETGEVSQFPWLVFVDPDGHTLGTSGSAVCHALSRIIEVFGHGPWNPPLRLLFGERRGRKTGRMYHDVRILPNGQG